MLDSVVEFSVARVKVRNIPDHACLCCSMVMSLHFFAWEVLFETFCPRFAGSGFQSREDLSLLLFLALIPFNRLLVRKFSHLCDLGCCSKDRGTVMPLPMCLFPKFPGHCFLLVSVSHEQYRSFCSTFSFELLDTVCTSVNTRCASSSQTDLHGAI
jgi:hypothetical protein